MSARKYWRSEMTDINQTRYFGFGEVSSTFKGHIIYGYKLTSNFQNIFFHWHYSPSGPRPTSMKLSVSLRSFSES
jgi:hypothetical protein